MRRHVLGVLIVEKCMALLISLRKASNGLPVAVAALLSVFLARPVRTPYALTSGYVGLVQIGVENEQWPSHLKSKLIRLKLATLELLTAV